MNTSMWFDLMQELGFDKNEKEFITILKAYSHKSRHYHGTLHIMDCLENVELNEETKTNYNLKLAIWYHDIVYNTLKKNNELKSAEEAIGFLAAQKASEGVKTEIFNLIMATVHQNPPKTINEAYIMDIDVSILGSDVNSYSEYTDKIRKEYWMIPWFIYRKKRIEVMKMFLKRKDLYFTDIYKEKYENKARLNIEAEIIKLESK